MEKMEKMVEVARQHYISALADSSVDMDTLETLYEVYTELKVALYGRD